MVGIYNVSPPLMKRGWNIFHVSRRQERVIYRVRVEWGASHDPE